MEIICRLNRGFYNFKGSIIFEIKKIIFNNQLTIIIAYAFLPELCARDSPKLFNDRKPHEEMIVWSDYDVLGSFINIMGNGMKNEMLDFSNCFSLQN